VELQISLNIIPAGGTIYTTVNNVELCFAEVIGYRADITPNFAKLPLCALQRLANDERVVDSTKWEIKDNARSVALEAQERRYKECMAAAVMDPHRNLSTNTLGVENALKGMVLAMRDADDCNWQNLGICGRLICVFVHSTFYVNVV
jgi:hypothetical protein